MKDDPVNILHCCGGHEDHIDSCPMLWDTRDWSQSELDLAEEMNGSED